MNLIANKLQPFIRGPLPRGLALFLGAFSLVNLVGGINRAGFDANLWWIDVRWLPGTLAKAFLLVGSLALAAYGVRPPRSAWRKALTFTCAALLGIIALANAGGFYLLLSRGELHSAMPIALSLPIAFGLGLIAASCYLQTSRRFEPAVAGGLLPAALAALGCVLALPLAEMFCFGKTDYRRHADIAVVFGARVYDDGRLSDALADRVRTAVQLYRDGCVSKLLFSGGPGDGAIDEPAAMKRVAVQLGVNAEDIILDADGLNTMATVRNSNPIFQAMGASHVLVVSHFYHLPRIKMAYQRAGVEVCTVPARESYLLRQMPYNIAREVAAFWVYYFRPLANSSRID